MPETNIESRNIMLSLDEVPPEPWESPLPQAPAVKPRIQIPGKDHTISNFAAELGRDLQNAPIYRHNGQVMHQDPETAKFIEMTPAKFVSWLEGYVECYEGHANEDGSGTTVRSINTGTANLVLQAGQFRKELPVVKTFNPIRQPVLDKDGGLLLLPTG